MSCQHSRDGREWVRDKKALAVTGRTRRAKVAMDGEGGRTARQRVKGEAKSCRVRKGGEKSRCRRRVVQVKVRWRWRGGREKSNESSHTHRIG